MQKNNVITVNNQIMKILNIKSTLMVYKSNLYELFDGQVTDWRDAPKGQQRDVLLFCSWLLPTAERCGCSRRLEVLNEKYGGDKSIANFPFPAKSAWRI